jgi:predicted MFS family arabinose efflux permease
VARTGPSYRSALRKRDFRLLVAALTQSSMGDWAYNVALVVYVYQHTHSAAWVSASTLGRMIPRFFASPYGGVLAERFERIHVMITADLVRLVFMTSVTVVAIQNGPSWAVIALAAGCSVAACAYDPATAAITPQMLGEEDLAAGNALTELINNVAIIAGPAVGAIVLALGSTSIVFAADAATFAISALLLARIRTRSTPTDVTGDGGPLRQMAVGLRAIVGSRTALLLCSFPVFTTMLFGADTVLFVFLSRNKLGTGTNGYGYLLVALGVGGVIASIFVNRIAAMPKLSLILATGMIVYAAPTALLITVHSPTLAFVIEAVRGIATLIVDVLAMTALQRSLAPDLISRVFGVFWAVCLGGLVVGAFVTPFLLRYAGLDATLLLDALVVPALVVLIFPRLAVLDRVVSAQAEVLAPRVRVLEQLGIFSAASQNVLERLAKNSEEIIVESGTSVVSEGEDADALYVLVDGRVDVTGRGEKGRTDKHIRYMKSPSFFGEIGLLQGIPRTATVTATEPTRLWRISGEDFLAALTETPLSASATAGLNMRLKRTHPSQQPKLPEQRGPAEDDEIATTLSH